MSVLKQFAIILLATITTSALVHAQTTGVESTVVYLKSDEAQFLKLINQFRKQIGLNELRIHSGLQAAAEKHSMWMAAQDIATHNDALDHNGPTPTTRFSDRIETEGYANYTLIGENIACGNESAAETFRQFALSPTHLKNMMNPRYRNIGIARAGTGAEICPYYWTTDFGSKASEASDLAEVTDLDVIANAIDAVAPGENDNGQSTLANLSNSMPQLKKPVTPATGIQCVIPYTLGKGALVSTVDTQTTIQLVASNDQYMLKVSYLQSSTLIRFLSKTLSNAAVVKNKFYPLLTIFSAPNNRIGGFMIQVDLSTGRAQFDPYPGYGGQSGLITCNVQSGF